MLAQYNVNHILDHHMVRRRASHILVGDVCDQLQCDKLHLQDECGLRENALSQQTYELLWSCTEDSQREMCVNLEKNPVLIQSPEEHGKPPWEDS